MSLLASPTLMTFVDAHLPLWATRDADELTRNRGRLLVATVLGTAAVAIATGAFHWLTDTRERGLFNMGCSLLAPLVLAVPHWTDRRGRQRSTHAVPGSGPTLRPMLDLSLAILMVVMLVGPLMSIHRYQLPVSIAILPFLAATLGGLRAGIVWTAITLSVISAMTAAVWADPLRGLISWNALIVATVVGVGGCLAEAAREQARRDAEASSLEASGLARSRDEKDAQLKASRELLAHAFRRMPAMLILSELASGRIIDVNECFERLSGWSLDEARGRTLSELNAWVSTDDRQRLVEAILDKGETQYVEIMLRTKSGSEIWLLAAADIFDMNGNSHVLAQGVDITDRKRVEQALAASRRLLEDRVVEGGELLRESQIALGRQRQLASIGTLAAGIAHQINNPIASIMAASEFALLSAEQRGAAGIELRDEALRSVIGEAARCGQIVKNVLRFARQQPTARWVEDVAPLALRAATLCRSYVTENGGELHLETDGAKLPALVSPIEIEQVFVNLIRNAAEALEGSGYVHVRTSLHEETIEIAIDDDGRGMPVDLLEHLFEPFNTTRVQDGGTGLGLSFAHGVIVDHGGEIQVESELGKGTRIRVQLPLAPA